MDPFYENQGVRIFHGDCREVLSDLNTNFTACITDPPYGIDFMGQDWDHGVPGEAFWRVIRERLSPGAPLFAFSGTRTFHRQWCAIEDAGFTLKDTLAYMYGAGFPKSHNVSKAIDDKKGAERQEQPNPIATKQTGQQDTNALSGNRETNSTITPIPATPEAEQWDGVGTALKPSWEPICYATNPRDGTYAENALEHGVAGLNIDAARIETDGERPKMKPLRKDGDKYGKGLEGGTQDGSTTKGRWPANVVLDERASVMLDRNVGVLESRSNVNQSFSGGGSGDTVNPGDRHLSHHHDRPELNADGGPSRFFYTAKASKSDRTAGMPDGAKNPHPTVKPTDLIGWLVRLATYPERNHLLDPFAGSGTLGYVCAEMGHKATLIEQDEESCELCAKRLQGQQALFST